MSKVAKGKDDKASYTPLNDSELAGATPRGEQELLPDSREVTAVEDGDPITAAQRQAMNKVMGGYLLSRYGSCAIEAESVYGAALVLPQLARSMQWQRDFTIEALRSYVFVILAVVIQSLILTMLEKHETVIDPFAGQMFLCDLGAFCGSVEDTGEPSCKGPAGTTITPPRLYSFDIWSTRTFVRDSLKMIFPDKADEIDKNVDPGEYGMESYWCRVLCCVLFMMTMVQEARNILTMGYTLYYLPSAPESWIVESGHEEEPADAAEDDGPVNEDEWLEGITLQAAGMPMVWKILNTVLLLIPKMLIWKLTVETGIVFLMETAGIDDLVVNSIALTFILDIDELCLATLTTPYTKSLLSRCRDLPLSDFKSQMASEQQRKSHSSKMTEKMALQRFGEDELQKHFSPMDIVYTLFPFRLLGVLGAAIFFIIGYYTSHCRSTETPFRFWPKPLHLAESTDFSFLNSFVPWLFPVATEDEAIWSMPE